MEHTKNIPDCPVEMTLQLIGDKWKVLIIRDLLTGTKRFNELMRSVSGITQKVLTSHLRAMEKNGLVTRTVYPEVPPKVEYTLTGTGYSLKPILDSMYTVSYTHLDVYKRQDRCKGTRRKPGRSDNQLQTRSTLHCSSHA